MQSTCSRVAGITALAVWLAAPAFAEPPKPIQPDLGRLASGQGAQGQVLSERSDRVASQEYATAVASRST